MTHRRRPINEEHLRSGLPELVRSSGYIQPSWVLIIIELSKIWQVSLPYISESPIGLLSGPSTVQTSLRIDVTFDRFADSRAIGHGLNHFWFNSGPDQELDCHFLWTDT